MVLKMNNFPDGLFAKWILGKGKFLFQRQHKKYVPNSSKRVFLLRIVNLMSLIHMPIPTLSSSS